MLYANSHLRCTASDTRDKNKSRTERSQSRPADGKLNSLGKTEPRGGLNEKRRQRWTCQAKAIEKEMRVVLRLPRLYDAVKRAEAYRL